MTSVPIRQSLRSRPLAALSLLVLIVALPMHLARAVDRDVAGWGWDESMHAALPAARMTVAVQEGQVGQVADAVLDCERYPFVFPIVLAAGQGLVGMGQDEARWIAFLLWCLVGLWGVGRLGRALSSGSERRPEHVLMPVALVALAPLPWRYAPSLFLEVPFLVLAAHTLASWIQWQRKPSTAWATLRIGTWLALCVFTKFNYGLLLVGGLLLDGLLSRVHPKSDSNDRETAAQGRLRCLAALPLGLIGLWWLALPLPGGLEMAARHRAALADFLGGNLGGGGLPWTWRALDFLTGASVHPAVVLFAIAGLCLSLRQVGRPAVRTLWIVFLSLAVPTALHPFHLDRLLIPSLLPFLVLASVGWIAACPPRAGGRMWAVASGLALLLILTSFWIPRHATARALGLLKLSSPSAPRLIDYLDRRQSLFGEVPTAGLPRTSLEQILDLIHTKVGTEQSVAWIGMSSELSPAALHLGLLARDGNPQRFLEDSRRKMDIVPNKGAADPLAPPLFATDEERDAFLDQTFKRFDWVLTTSPVDLKDRSARRPIAAQFHQPLGARLGYQPTELGTVTIPAVGADPNLPTKPGLEVRFTAWCVPRE